MKEEADNAGWRTEVLPQRRDLDPRRRRKRKGNGDLGGKEKLEYETKEEREYMGSKEKNHSNRVISRAAILVESGRERR